MQVARGFGAWVVLNNGSVLSTAGSDNHLFAGPATNKTELYDPDTNSWHRAADLLGWNESAASGGGARRSFSFRSATLLANGSVMACCNPSGYQLWDPTKDEWTAVPRPIRAVDGNCGSSVTHPQFCMPAAGAVATLANGSVVAVGGSVQSITQHGGTISYGSRGTVTAQRWDPSSGNWSDFPSMLFPRTLFGLLRLENGSLLAAGGFKSDTSEIWHPHTGLWHRSGNMALGTRQNFNLVQVPTGDVFAVGGLTINCDGQSSPACRRSYCWASPSVERWDPATGMWEVRFATQAFLPQRCHLSGQPRLH
jgi:hypothetical protein